MYSPLKLRSPRITISLALATAILAAASTVRADTTVNFAIQYQDYGGTAHPLQSMTVTYIDGLNSTQFAGPLVTDAAGKVTLVTPYANVDSSNNLNVQLNIVDTIPNVGSAYLNNAAAQPYQYMPGGSGAYLVTKDTNSIFFPVSFNNSTDAIKMMGVLEYVKFVRDYYVNTASYSAVLPAIRINYNSGNVGSSMGGGTMTLGYSAWGSLDVILHEYGHHVAENNSLEGAGLGLAHTFDADNIGAANGGKAYGNLNGSKLAWQEGIATYLSMVAQREANVQGAFPGIPADAGNGAYDSFAPAANVTRVVASDFAWSVSINSLEIQVGPFDIPDPEGIFGDPTDGNPPRFSHGKGEGDEMSVMRTLYDFEQNTDVEAYARPGQSDLSHFGGPRIFNLMKSVTGANKGTMYGFWQKITADVRSVTGKPLVGLAAAAPDAQAVSRLGMTLEQNAISSIPLTLGEQPDNEPTLTWTEQNNVNSLLFKVLIYKADWSALVVQSDQIAKGVVSFTVPNPLAPGDYEYVILNSPMLAAAGELDTSSATNIYNWYWSGDATFTVPGAVPEPASLMILGLGGIALLRRRRPKGP